MIHILHVLTSLGLGGVERAFTDLVARSDRTQYRHTVCYLRNSPELLSELEAAHCEAICLNAPAIKDIPRAVRQLRSIIREYAPNIIQSATFEANVVARLAKVGTNLPHVSWIVSMEYDPRSVRAAGWSRRSNMYRRAVDIVTARLARTKFVACSNVVRQSIIDRLAAPAETVGVIYNPVDPNTLKVSVQEIASLYNELMIDSSHYIYFNVGRMDAAKAQMTLLEAFAKIVNGQPHARLVILGRGVLRDHIIDRAEELGIADRVRFPSFALRIAPYFAIADVFLFPSLLEGLPVALLEAMCAGVPSIVSDIPPHVEVLQSGKTGLVVARGSVSEMADAMDKLYHSIDRRTAMGRAAKSSALPRFSIEVVAPQWESLYTSLVPQKQLSNW